MYYRVFLSIILLLPVQLLAQACPGHDVPDTVKGLYIKYSVTDELYIKLNKKWGAPSSVVGDEVKELFKWKGYEWKRRYGKYFATDDESEEKFREEYSRKMESIETRQAQGLEVSLDEINNLGLELMNHRPKQKVFEYDWVDVETPGYSLYYNSANQTGYGVLGRRLTRSDRSRVDNNTKYQMDSWINSNFKDAGKVFGFEKLSTRQDRMLGYDVICETVKTSFKDFQRNYKQIETCKANIAGVEVILFERTGEQGQQYTLQAVEVNSTYPFRKEKFCAPDYVKLRTP